MSSQAFEFVSFIPHPKHSSILCAFAGKIGFVSSPQRLNVAMTRAKQLLIVIGDFATLAKRNAMFQALRAHAIEQRVFVNASKIPELARLVSERRMQVEALEKLLITKTGAPASVHFRQHRHSLPHHAFASSSRFTGPASLGISHEDEDGGDDDERRRPLRPATRLTLVPAASVSASASAPALSQSASVPAAPAAAVSNLPAVGSVTPAPSATSPPSALLKSATAQPSPVAVSSSEVASAIASAYDKKYEEEEEDTDDDAKAHGDDLDDLLATDQDVLESLPYQLQISDQVRVQLQSLHASARHAAFRILIQVRESEETRFTTATLPLITANHCTSALGLPD